MISFFALLGEYHIIGKKVGLPMNKPAIYIAEV